MNNNKYIKILLLAIYLISTLNSLAQKELQITYKVKNGTTPEHKQINSFLRANHQSVLYKESTTSFRGRPGEEKDVYIPISYMFRDLGSNTIWSEDNYQLVVKEQMDLFKWTFSQVTDTILGYTCRKAEANFRGRDYSAWFTTELPFKAAPWKISGLPGVVLKLETSDGFYALEATKLSIIDATEEIQMPFDDDKSLDWNEYVQVYKKKIEESEKKIKAMEIKYGRKYNFTHPKVEIIIEKNRNPLEVFLKDKGLIK